MTEIRSLEPIDFKGKPAWPEDLGTRAELCMLPLSMLVVDDRYQRKIGPKGKATIRRILENFDWRKFAPVIATKNEDGRYAIIDGQHRSTAALMITSIDLVPCMVIDVTPEEAAACFAAINACVTSMTPGQIFHARCAAGEKEAVAVRGVCDASGVKILTGKSGGSEYEVGETMAVGALQRCFAKYGGDVLTTSLMTIVESADGNPGCLRAGVIESICEVLRCNPGWLNAGGKLLAAFDDLDLYEVVEKAGVQARYSESTTKHFLQAQIRWHLTQYFSNWKAVA